MVGWGQYVVTNEKAGQTLPWLLAPDPATGSPCIRVASKRVCFPRRRLDGIGGPGVTPAKRGPLAGTRVPPCVCFPHRRLKWWAPLDLHQEGRNNGFTDRPRCVTGLCAQNGAGIESMAAGGPDDGYFPITTMEPPEGFEPPTSAYKADDLPFNR